MPTMQLVFASRNPGKIKEIQDLLRPFDVQVLSAGELDVPAVEETGETFEENALLKAVAVSKASGLPAIADDSGLCVHALKDAPGVHTARFAEKCGGYSQAFDALLKEVAGKDASAHFACVIAFAFPNGTTQTFTGRVDGTLVPPEGTDGFGFDPIFMPNGYNMTFAQMPADEKNKISHRGQAVAAFLEKFQDFIEK